MVNQKINIDESKIKEMMDKGLSNREIARYFKCNEITIRRHRQKNNIESSKNLRGRPEILTKREENFMIRKFYNREIQNTTHGKILVKDFFQKVVGNSLVRNKLKKHGFKGYKIYKKPYISKANKKKRILFYNKFKNSSYEEFLNIIFSDESTFRVLNVKGGQYFYKMSTDKTGTPMYARTQKFGKGSVMIWGFKTGKGNF